MSICAIWIISLEARSTSSKGLIFSRHYPIVLKKARSNGFLPASQLPSDEDIASAILDELQIFRTKNEFVQRFDSCQIQRQAPMYSILNGAIWPVVAITKNGLTFACLPLLTIKNDGIKKLTCSEMGPVTMAYSLLQNIAEVMCSHQSETAAEEKLQELRDYLFICMPFGTPREMDPATVRGILSSKDSLIPKQKVPAWRPVAYKGKQNIHLFIHENVRCVQYDRSEVPDVCEVYGTIECKTELEGAPEVSFDLLSSTDSELLENMSFHPCVQLSGVISTNIDVDDKKSLATNYDVKPIRFCPPLESFKLCHYRSSVGVPPIFCYYQMTGDEDHAKIKIQLKLWKKMKNIFEYLRVTVPFFNRKPVKRIESVPSSSNFVIVDKNTVLWTVGSKLPSKTLEISIEATVYFSTADEPIAKYDSFCTGLNSYMLVFFKVADYVYSGLKIVNESLRVYPSSKIKTNRGAEFASAEYKIWNSLGDVLGVS